MDAVPPGGPVPPDDPNPKDWVEEFRRRCEEVRHAADEWAVRWHEPEGRFISALLGAIEALGRLTSSVQGVIAAAGREGRAAAEVEYAQARELRVAADAALRQARQLQLSLVAEQENVVVRMIHETLPMFTERLQKVLAIREQRWNADLRRRRYALAGAVTLGIFLAGYALSWWQDSDRIAAFDRCLEHPLQAAGRFYCGIDGFVVPPEPAGK